MVGDLLAEYGIPSAAIGVLHDGEITEVAVGVQNIRTGEPITIPAQFTITFSPSSSLKALMNQARPKAAAGK